MLSAWFRVIRVRFLLASVIAVSTGLALSWWYGSGIDVISAALTLAGVAALHASVDMLNDYWDFKRGIDTKTKRTLLSGGTGVLPEGLLEPGRVYRAGLAFLILGTSIGGYFVVTAGVVLAVILGFAVISIYFYSTKIVDSGMAEVFVAVKGTMIVMGTFFIQSLTITVESVLAGVAIGILSSVVLFAASFPDHDADKSGGRKTLVVVAGREKASRIFWAFPLAAYGVIVSSVLLGLFPAYALSTLAAAPLVAISGMCLRRHYNDTDRLVPVMINVLKFSRITGALLAFGFVAPELIAFAS